MRQEIDETLFEFPCSYPVKAMGNDNEDFEALVVSLVKKHCEQVDSVKTRPSKNGNFQAVTVTITATSKHQLDAIYFELTGHEKVLMAI